MDGQMIATAPCLVHGGMFECSPDHVVTVYVEAGTGRVVPGPARDGVRQAAICDPCVEKINEERRENGLDPFETAAEHAARWADTPWAGPR